MPNDIEKDFDKVVEEMSNKIKQAIELLKEANQLASQAGVTTDYYGDLANLKEVVQDISPAPQAWNQSSWCAFSEDNDGWNNSGCSGN